MKDILKPISNFLDNIVGSILWKFEVNMIKIVGVDTFFVIENRFFRNAQQRELLKLGFFASKN